MKQRRAMTGLADCICQLFTDNGVPIYYEHVYDGGQFFTWVHNNIVAELHGNKLVIWHTKHNANALGRGVLDIYSDDIEGHIMSSIDDIRIDIAYVETCSIQSIYDIHEFREMLKPMPNDQYIGILYPYSLYAAYWLYSRGVVMCDDNRLNAIFSNFIRSVSDDIKYTNDVINASSQMAKKIMMLRAIIATFDASSEKPVNMLPHSYRSKFLDKCDLDHQISKESILNILSQTERASTAQDLLLGRILYLMFWRRANDGSDSIYKLAVNRLINA